MADTANFRFRLYVAGDAPNSIQALANLSDLCRKHLHGRHEIEIVDVHGAPFRALEDGVYLTPTLMKLAPLPARRVVGALDDRSLVLRTLGLPDPRP